MTNAMHAAPPAPALVGCSHGTGNHDGRAAIRSIVDGVRSRRPELTVREAFVDVQQPEVADVVRDTLGDGAPGVVVVPLLLSVGFHVKVDIAAAVDLPSAEASAPLGPDDRLVEILADRLAAAGLRDGDVVVLAAAGSSDAAAALAVEAVAAGLSDTLDQPVTIGYGAGAEPRVPAAVAAAREGLTGDGRVVVASYLLAPGFFHDRVLEAGADVVTDPLAPDERLVDIVLDRYDAVAPGLPRRD
ncbi:CbiX/SirB N-terminal domain-containing protein [Cellulomonas sp.]|uniref:sirohydrochlorin chelatase n=1 Tax=Cellulomonas sp. TaxID=40001 RepID=UPI001B27A7A4|nr:CbiX/SirB N-terminal domain-containing protein [Cellulomonas sp.]MBO9555356.1 sirohydrochlorin chelatase [Cellulomonas sp.]